jgi:hypothetical protein
MRGIGVQSLSRSRYRCRTIATDVEKAFDSVL